jgi:hypothetical protein
MKKNVLQKECNQKRQRNDLLFTSALVLAMMFGSLPLQAQPCTTLSFAPAVAYPSGGNLPLSLTSADFNGDGKPDLAAANRGPEFMPTNGNVGVLLNNGSGSFAPAVTYPAGSAPASIVAADFNGDTKPDLAVSNVNDLLSPGTVNVLLNTGSGSFAPATSFASGGFAPFSIASADINGDTKPDLIVANLFDNNVGVLLNNGSGSFAPAVLYPSGGAGPRIVASGDFNGDGRADLVVANQSSNNVGVLLNNGSGGFAPVVTYSTGGNQPVSVTTGDFNGDNKPDLTTANISSDNIGVLLNNGSGSFAPPVNYGSGGDDPFSVATGDVNGDGKTDIAVVNRNSQTIGVLLGNGSGSFAAPVSFPTAGLGPRYVLIRDFNGDNKPDLATANLDANTISVLLNNCALAAMLTWYRDFDGDGFGDPAKTIMAASQPAGYVANNQDCNDYRVYYEDLDNDGWGNSTKLPCGTITRTGDCNDNDNRVHSPQTFYRDADGDSWGNAAVTTTVCSSITPSGYVANRMDCNDNDAAIRYCPAMTVSTKGKEVQELRKAALTLLAAPNPFGASTRVQYTVPVDSRVNIRVFDVTGREVGMIYQGIRTAGTYYAEYNTQKLSQGIYYCRLTATVNGKTFEQTQKLVKAN